MRRLWQGIGALALVSACGGHDGGPDPEEVDATVATDCAQIAWQRAEALCPRLHGEEVGFQRFCGNVFEVGAAYPFSALPHVYVPDAQVTVYDAAAFFADPAGATPLGSTTTVDECGTYATEVLDLQGAELLAIVADDAPGHDVLRAGVYTVAPDPNRLPQMYAQTIRRSSDEAWSAAAGLDGETFVDRGVLHLQFWSDFVNGDPDVSCALSGAVAVRDGVQVPDSDFYPFVADTVTYSCKNNDEDGPGTEFTNITVDAAQLVTGLIGTALLLGSPYNPMVLHSGIVPGDGPCEYWEEALIGAPPGYVMPIQLNSMCTPFP